ncbi:acetyl-CoA carboxylase biotin carboxylase subunit family protein [Kitasatospora sp. NPDC101157]|uniref:ATP-grasp domain-containing protein n=1 Tax=Kitasatospora sp. NPDC101157 TaxID=3364098 RepID=UPI00381C38E6
MTRVLILNRSALSRARYREWLGEEAVICLLQNAATADVDPAESACDEVVLVADYDTSGLAEAEAIRMHERYRFDRILAFSEYDLMRAARLREHLGLPGQTVESALAFRDKLVMKQRLAEHRVPVAAFGILDFATDLLEFTERHGFPVVVKPRSASGSRGVRVLADEEELRTWLAGDFTGLPQPGSWMVEEFVDGAMFHVDGLLRQGEAEICWPSETTSCLGFHQGAAIVSHQLDAGDPRTEPLRRLTRDTLAALPHPDVMAFHAELWQRRDGTLLVNEIAGRIGGGPIQKAVASGFGCALKERLVRAELRPDTLAPAGDLANAVPAPYAGYVILPTPIGTVAALPPQPFDRPWATAKLKAAVGGSFSGAVSSVDEIGSCVVTGADGGQVRERLDEFVDWFAEGFRVSR